MIGSKSRFEMGSTLKRVEELKSLATDKVASGKVEEIKEEIEEECGSCYGAGEDGECCNSCDDVKRAYQR